MARDCKYTIPAFNIREPSNRWHGRFGGLALRVVPLRHLPANHDLGQFRHVGGTGNHSRSAG